MRRWMFALLLPVLATLVIAQDAPDPYAPVELLAPQVINRFPHDPEAFTQGLLLHSDGLLYESTGLYGESDLRAVEVESGEVVRQFDIPEQIFAEGLTLLGNRLFQISWREQVALVYEIETGIAEDTFEPLGAFQYTGEGWGLWDDESLLYMSDGSHVITVRDPETFAPVRTMNVTLYGAYVDEINELECVDGNIWANVWQTDSILRIDAQTGIVTGVVDGRALLSPEERAALESGAVLNGIAYNPETETFLVTGKRWPALFEVEFVPAG